MVAQLVPPPHPILACAEQICSELAATTDLQPVSMRSDDKRAVLLMLSEAQRRLDELHLRVIAASDDVAADDGARDVAAWLASRTQADPPDLRADQALAAAIDQRWCRVGAGLAAGALSKEHAKVIVRGLEDLPAAVGPEVLAQAEAQLVEWAGEFKPSELRRLARHILDSVAPEIAEAEEAKRLEREEQHAQDKCRLALRPVGDGTTSMSGLVADADAVRLRTYLEAFTSPRKHDDAIAGEEDRIPYARKLGQGFCALLEHLDPDKLPHHGGDATSVMVTISLDALRADLGCGDDISASEARRLACTARILPAVLGGKGEVLDLGRTRRLFTAAQRKAMRLRDKRCRADGCSIPATWAEAHHLRPWSEGGKSDLADGILLCSWHHHRIHDRRFDHDRLASGDIRFHRRR